MNTVYKKDLVAVQNHTTLQTPLFGEVRRGVFEVFASLTLFSWIEHYFPWIATVMLELDSYFFLQNWPRYFL